MPRKKNTKDEESSKVEECLTKDEVSSEEDSSPESFTVQEDNIVVDTSETRPLAISDFQKECTKNIDEIFAGNILAVPPFVDSLIAFFSENQPDPRNKKLYAAHMGAKVQYLLKYTWERGNNTAQNCITSSGGQTNILENVTNQLELFLLGVLVAIGPCKGVWAGRFAAHATTLWSPLIGKNHSKYMQTGALALILLSSFTSFMIETMKFCLEFMLGIEKNGIINNRNALIKFGGAWCTVSLGDLCPELSLAVVLAVILM